MFIARIASVMEFLSVGSQRYVCLEYILHWAVLMGEKAKSRSGNI